jgi:hydrogenase nickel incorporation protein HypA/HybF
MHELGVSQRILAIALENAGEGRKVTQIHLRIGDLASIVDDSLQFYWEMISKGTAAEKATLQFHRIGAEFRCRECEHQFAPSGTGFNCPACGSEKVAVISGVDFTVDAIEVE